MTQKFFADEYKKMRPKMIPINVKTHYIRRENDGQEKMEISIRHRWNDGGKKSTAPGIPRRSPIQVLTGPDVA